MDFSEFRPGDWLIITGGGVMLVFGLALDWASFGSIKLNNAFDYFLTGGIAWLLLVAAALLAFLLVAGLIRPGNVRWPLILLVSNRDRLADAAPARPRAGEIDLAPANQTWAISTEPPACTSRSSPRRSRSRAP